jgi:tetratricopeptide (TPR) repeat protein
MSIGTKVAMAMSGMIALIVTLPAASANETDIIFGRDPLADCATMAAQAETRGSATKMAVSVCDQAIDRAKDLREELAAAYINRSVLHLARLEYAAAIADSDASLRVRRDWPQAMVNRGVALSATGHFREAADSFTGALALNPAHPEIIYFNRALAREDSGDLKGAYLDYRKAAQLAPTWDEPKQQLARFTVAAPPVS